MQTRTEAASHQSQANGDSLWVGQGQAAASIGLEVWKKVEVTDPDETKSFNKGGSKGPRLHPSTRSNVPLRPSGRLVLAGVSS